MLYQLSYSRSRASSRVTLWWGEDSNLRRLSRQIYSLVPLATRVPHRQGFLLVFLINVNRR